MNRMTRRRKATFTDLPAWYKEIRVSRKSDGVRGTLNLYAGHYSREAAIREASRKYNIDFSELEI